MENTISILAIFISLLSLAISALTSWRQTPRLTTSSKAIKCSTTHDYAQLYIKAVNHGGGQIPLRYLWGIYSCGEVSGIELDSPPLKLGAGELYETRIKKFEGMMMYFGEHGEKSSDLVDLYFEDTKGKKYFIQQAKDNIARLKKSNFKFGSEY